jgi:hypothetical protein
VFFEDHPIPTLLISAAVLLAWVLVAGAVTDAFASAALVVAGLAGSSAFGLALASHLADRHLPPKPREEDRPRQTPPADSPPLPPPGALDGPDLQFTDRLRHERDAAPSRRR